MSARWTGPIARPCTVLAGPSTASAPPGGDNTPVMPGLIFDMSAQRTADYTLSGVEATQFGPFTEVVGVSRPSYDATGVNGLPAFLFEGTDRLETASALPDLGAGATYYWAGKLPSGINPAILAYAAPLTVQVDMRTVNRVQLFIKTSSGSEVLQFLDVNSGMVDGAPYAFGLSVSNAGVTVSDGSQHQTLTLAGTINATVDPVRLQADGTPHHTGQLIACNGVHSTSKMAEIITYMQEQWAI